MLVLISNATWVSIMMSVIITIITIIVVAIVSATAAIILIDMMTLMMMMMMMMMMIIMMITIIIIIITIRNHISMPTRPDKSAALGKIRCLAIFNSNIRQALVDHSKKDLNPKHRYTRVRA